MDRGSREYLDSIILEKLAIAAAMVRSLNSAGIKTRCGREYGGSNAGRR